MVLNGMGLQTRPACSCIDPKPVQQGGIPIIMAGFSPAALKRAARIADGFNPVALSCEMLEGMVNTFRAAAGEAGRNPSTLKIIVRVNGLITIAPLPEEGRPFLGGSPDQIARDLDKVRKLQVDHVFFTETVTSDLEQYIECLGRLQSVVRA